ncbi:type IV pilin N-terminal domain-containing protein [Halococcus dombrowskii]|uniref:Type IV pilin N-terminal domain-containing protein n=1 Tax=Halococcus dombrowskii TaxID=179637 RepID=A0AAV3SHA3_HALDO|nr:type IV pilin [Halococcus dombrowskii]UOO93931.1 type IV pilin N-terminal domain-containing protein [Halococcus dombrowskii]
MKERIKQFVADKRGVSPVIGVVLMVAVVVILAAVIGAFVLGLGGNQDTTPQASFSYDSASGNVVYEGGDQITASNLKAVSGDTEKPFSSGKDGSTVSAGDSVKIDASAGDTVRVVYTDPDGGDSTTLWKTTV